MLFTLTVTCSTVRERRGWERGKQGDTSAPEWCLYQIRENGKDRVDLWRMAAHDIAIINNLIEEAKFGQTSTTVVAAPEFPPLDQRDAFASPQPVTQSQQQVLRPFQPPEDPITTSQQIDITTHGVNLSGELREVDIANVMQSINLCKMSGRLNVYDPTHQVEIFFNNGELVHAISSPLMDTSQGIKGDKVLLEVFSWDDGSFQFQHGWQTAERSINKLLQNLILEGATIRDYKNSLEQRGVFMHTQLERLESNLSESQFEAKLQNGLPMHMDFQKKVFLALREPHSLQEVLDAVPMDRVVWIPVVYSLLHCNMIGAKGGATTDNGAGAEQYADAFANISELIRNADRGLLQPDSGMLSYGLFLSLAEKELSRRIPFCLAMFEFSVPAAAITNESLKAITTTFDTIKRPYEIISFWQPNKVVMLLPMSKREDSEPRINTFLDALAKEPDMDGISLTCGLSNAPKDGTQLADVLASSLKLMKKAQQENARIRTSD